MSDSCSFSDLVGKVFESVSSDRDSVTFSNKTEKFTLMHFQDCCESVSVEDICGDLTDLVGSPIVEAVESESRNTEPKSEFTDSCTWTFYRISTVKGTVTIRFYGESNGYYSESVSLIRGTV